MTKRIINSKPTTSLRWVRRGEERILQQSFAVTTIDDETGHMAGSYEWIEVPTFMEMTHEAIPPLTSIKIEVRRDDKHLEGLIEHIIAKLDSVAPDCPQSQEGTATLSSGCDHG